MKRPVLIVVAIVLTFLALIVAYTLGSPDAPNAGAVSAPTAKH